MRGRGRTIAAGGALLFGLVIAVVVYRRSEFEALPEREAPETSRPEAEPVPSEVILPGDDIMADFAAPDRTPMQDLDQVFHVLDVYQLLLKIDGGLPLGSNQEIVEALTGTNPHRMVFLSPDHPAIDARGRLVDRWRTPFFFHAVARDRIEIRSAGPDGTMWTDDDIHRNANGSFRRAEDVVPKSLFGDGGQ